MRAAWRKNCLRKSNRQIFIGEEIWIIDNWTINKASSCTLFGIVLIFFTLPGMGLCFGYVTKTARLSAYQD